MQLLKNSHCTFKFIASPNSTKPHSAVKTNIVIEILSTCQSNTDKQNQNMNVLHVSYEEVRIAVVFLNLHPSLFHPFKFIQTALDPFGFFCFVTLKYWALVGKTLFIAHLLWWHEIKNVYWTNMNISREKHICKVIWIKIPVQYPVPLGLICSSIYRCLMMSLLYWQHVQPFFQVISFASSHLFPWKGPLAVKCKTYLGIKIYSEHSVHTLMQMLLLWLMISSEWIFIAKEKM